MNFKKWQKISETYIDKNVLNHKHDYCLKHLLIITNINAKASIGYYNKKEYYYVLKCNKCNSFIPDSIKGNYNHHVLEGKMIDADLPIIVANTNDKCPHYSFGKLVDVKLVKN